MVGVVVFHVGSFQGVPAWIDSDVFLLQIMQFFVFFDFFFVPDSAGHATSSVFLLEPKEPAPAKQKRGSTSEKAGACDYLKDIDSTWVYLKMGYTPNYSHLVGIMIINHWV